MKVSLNWIKEYTDINTSVEELVEKIGAQLGAVEKVVDLGKKYQGIVVARVVTCEPHPNADKLKLCTIDDGVITPSVKRNAEGHVQVVCGAPEVAVGMTVAWLPPGTVVPSTFEKDPLTLESRDIRGQVSEGMLGTPKELAVSDDHSGLLLVEDTITPGTSFAKAYGFDDYIIDIENKMFTHRPDLFGILGVAREIAGIGQQQFKSPDWYHKSLQPSNPQDINLLPLRVINEVPSLTPRIMVVVIDNITINSSPLWIQAALTRVGIRPINNIVDITNYVMHLTAQPMHAFDYNKIKQCSGDTPAIGPRLARENEELTLLGGKKLRLTTNDIVIATDNQAVDLAGVMGGADTEVDEKTTAVILTVNSFDMYAIRRATMRHGVFTDAATRYTKNQSPLQNDRVLAKAMDMMHEFSGSHQASEIFDIKNNIPVATTVDVTSGFINARLGTEIAVDDMGGLLKNVEFTVATEGDKLSVTAPFWRTDIEIPEDVVEEVGRLYGYDHLPLELPTRDLTPPQPDSMMTLKSNIRGILAKAGANELLTYSFVHGNLLDKVGQDREKAFKLSNAISPDLQYYRLSLVPSLLDKVHPNIKAGFDNFAIFEIGKTHMKGIDGSDKLPLEMERVALVFAADDKQARYTGAPYYQARKYLTTLLKSLGAAYSIEPVDFELTYLVDQLESRPYNPNRLAYIRIEGAIAGFIGELREPVHRALKLPAFTAAFEIDLIRLHRNITNDTQYVPLSRFPKVQQDISLKLPATVTYLEVYNLLNSQLLELENTHATLTPLDIYQRPDDKEHKQMTFRFTIAHHDKTLKSEEVNTMLDQAALIANKKLSAERL